MSDNPFQDIEDSLPDVTLDDAKKVILGIIDKCFRKMEGTGRCSPCDHPEEDECRYSAIGKEKAVMGAMMAMKDIFEMATYQLCFRPETSGRFPDAAKEAIRKIIECSAACDKAVRIMKGEPPAHISDILKGLLSDIKSHLPDNVGITVIPIGFDELTTERIREILEQIESGNIEASQLPNDLKVEDLNAMLKRAEEEEE